MIQEKICPSCSKTFISKRKDTIACSRLCYTHSKHKKKIYPNREKIKKDLIGKRFGRLLVLEFSDWIVYKYTTKSDTRKSRWICLCDCGNKVICRADAMQSSNTTSCGCYNKEMIRKASKIRKFPDNIAQQNLIIGKYKWEAKKRNYIWNLSKDEFIFLIEQNCFYCGQEPTATDRRTKYPFNGVDRINNNIGYEKNNCVTCCAICNKMKSIQTYNEFIEKCSKISNLHKKD